ncbi:hypothetical protein NK638_07870 [Psychrobacter sp. A3]|uniref:hypothetical protein n=1 Tax=Psychrobacter sp. A3 TaxID=2992754 RepID=UPI00237A585A|nr:hypothetical protein [Psychrobacter sp. A3]MDE0491441.1 hypothetical protein [Psychrobacter sp. A3]
MDTNTDTTNHTAANNTEKRAYAVVLYGATSFVGQITAHYLTHFLSNAKNKDGTRLAVQTCQQSRYHHCQ